MGCGASTANTYMGEADFNELIGRKLGDVNIVDFKIDCDEITPPWNITVCGRESKFGFMGLVKDNILLVPYDQGHIVCYPIRDEQYGMSSDFSGCAMVKFRYGEQMYIGHICLLGKTNSFDCRSLWIKFITDSSDIISDIILFKPMTSDLQDTQFRLGLDATGKPRTNICGLITPDNECYSILVNIETKEAIQIIKRQKEKL